MVSALQKPFKIVEQWKKGRLASTMGTSTADKGDLVGDPMHLFLSFWDDEFFLYIKQQSDVYAQRKQPTCSFEVSVDELKVFVTILFVSGYCTLPRRDMYWSVDADLRNEVVAAAMPRNRFREILRYVHLSDNMNLPENDKLCQNSISYHAAEVFAL